MKALVGWYEVLERSRDAGERCPDAISLVTASFSGSDIARLSTFTKCQRSLIRTS